MDALPAVAGVEAETHQRGTNVVAGFDGRSPIGTIIAKHVAAVLDLVILRKFEQASGEMPIERTGGILHGNGDAICGGILAGCDGAIVDSNQFGHLAMQHSAGANADFFRQRKQQVAIDRQDRLGLAQGPRGRQHCGNAGLIVEMTRRNKAGLDEFRLRIDRHGVADLRCQARASR